MNTSNSALMDMAERSLKSRWGLAIGTFLVYLFITGGMQVAIHYHHYFVYIIALIISGPMAYGMAVFTLALSRNEDAQFEQIFKGFERFGITLGTYLLMVVFIVLWSLLLIIPGIMAAISYSMTFFILVDEPHIGSMDAIDKSKRMMNGYKWKYFCLCLRYFLLALLCILTLGIGFLWLIPYMHVGMANFYNDIKDNQMVVEAI